MSTQTILAGIGYAVGSYFGYPQLGAIVGSLVGAALAPTTKTQGPRLDDQKVTVSTYGAGIPSVNGTVRLGGNVVDSTDKIKVGTTTSQGKGGGTENTSYKYFVHMAVALCATPADGSLVTIRKVWKDGKLIYDASSGIPVGSALASATSPYSFLVLYQGHEDQLPDPLEELQHGIGNVPAYRGIVRARLNAVECPGGRVPQFSFEVAIGATLVNVFSDLSSFPDSVAAAQIMGGIVTSEGAVHFKADNQVHSLPRLAVNTAIGVGYNTVLLSSIQPTPYTGPSIPIGINGGNPAFLQLSLESAADSTSNTITVTRVDAYGSPSFVIWTVTSPGETIYGYKWAAFDPTSQRYALIPNTGSPATSLILDGSLVPAPAQGYGPAAFYNGLLYLIKADGSSVAIWNGSLWTAISVPVPTSTGTPNPLLHVDQNGVFAFVVDGSGGGGLWKLSGASFVLITSNVKVKAPDGNQAGTQAYTSFFTNGNYAILGPNDLRNGSYSYTMVRINTVQTSAASVSAIITEQCIRTGLSSSQFDVSTITDSVWGYTLTNPASARTNIQPLMTAFAIDATEENGVIRFFYRASATSVATISYAELASIEDGGTPGDPMPLARAQEAELPRSVAVSYLNKDFDYQTSTEKANRQTTISKLDQTIDLSMSVGADVAATVAQRVLIDSWNERNHRTLKVSRKYAFVSAGDVVTITFQDGTRIDWRLIKVTDTGVLLEWEGVPANAAIYTQVVTGSAGYAPATVNALGTQTRLQILDIPQLRDTDNNAGLYAAMCGFGSPWSGAELFFGDNTTNLASAGTVSAPAPIGFGETVPGTWSSGFVDEVNTFTVNIGSATFSNSTRDVLLANGAEIWAYGAPGRWEIGASALGSSLGNGRYVLSRHIRGMFGSERYAGKQSIGDTFVLLRIAGMQHPVIGTSYLGQPKTFQAVSQGRDATGAALQSYTSTGEGLKPHSPVNLRRTNTNDLTVDRRSRLSMNNLTGTLPLGEATEHYTWEFYTSNTYASLIGTVTTNTPLVTAAQQTAIGITPASPAFVKVRQVSDSVGIGHELQATA